VFRLYRETVLTCMDLPGGASRLAVHADDDIQDHVRDGDIRRPAEPCGDGNDRRKETCDDVSQSGHEPDYFVEAEPDAGAGNRERFVKKDFQGSRRVVTHDPGVAVPPFQSAALGRRTPPAYGRFGCHASESFIGASSWNSQIRSMLQSKA
jgi:hypothetical protein